MYSHLIDGTLHCLITHLSWLHMQDINTNHFPLELWCEDYSILDQAVEDIEHGLDSILTGSNVRLELDTSADEPDVMPSSVSAGLLCSVVFLIILDCNLLLV